MIIEETPPQEREVKTQVQIESDLKEDVSPPSEYFIDKKEEDHIPPAVEKSEKVETVERQGELHIESLEKEMGELGRDRSTGDDRELLKTQEIEEGHKPEAARKPAWFKKSAVYLLILLFLLCGVYLSLFSEIGNHAVSLTSSSLSAFVEKIRGVGQKDEEVGPAQVELGEIRQRFVSNGSVGIIRVVEGTAINQSTHPMTRIRVKGELMGEGSLLLDQRESYCGNLLTDDELVTMTEEQIQKELSNSQGSDVSNDRIIPKGQIPFMVVFPREPAGVMKTFVVPVGAERLLP